MGHIGPNFQPPRPPVNPGAARPAAGAENAAPPTGQMPGAGLVGGAVDGHLALAPLFAFENAMTSAQLVQLLKNLLQMPRELVQLMALLASLDGENTQMLLKQLVADDVKIPLEALRQLLLGKADQCQDKLLKLMQSSQMNLTGSGKQMGDLMSMLTTLVGKAQASPTEALQTTLALYLPYYPLEAPQRFSMHFEPMEGGEEGGGDDAQLILLIDTLTLGSFQIAIAALHKTQLLIRVSHEAAAAGVLAELERQVADALRADSLPVPEILFAERPARPGVQQGMPGVSDERFGGQSVAGGTPTELGKQAVGIHPAGGVSVLAVHAAYLLIRIVLELDNRQAVNLKRAQP